jgi:hypothetical protein
MMKAVVGDRSTAWVLAAELGHADVLAARRGHLVDTARRDRTRRGRRWCLEGPSRAAAVGRRMLSLLATAGVSRDASVTARPASTGP